MALAIVAAVSAVSQPAHAQLRSNAQAEQSRSLLGRAPTRTLPESGRYVAESGENFIFDRSGSRPLFRFERRQETWALRPTPAPRGDTIYRNDQGAQVLRVTPEGGVTLYTVAAPNGTPASVTGPAPALTQPALGPVQLFNLMQTRSAMVTRALGRIVRINLSGDRSEQLCVEALVISTDAVLRMARSATRREQLSGLRSITIQEGGTMSVRYRNGDLRVVVDPDRGIEGRPSSARIIQALSDG
jgi:hypothetical protein